MKILKFLFPGHCEPKPIPQEAYIFDQDRISCLRKSVSCTNFSIYICVSKFSFQGVFLAKIYNWKIMVGLLSWATSLYYTRGISCGVTQLGYSIIREEWWWMGWNLFAEQWCIFGRCNTWALPTALPFKRMMEYLTQAAQQHSSRRIRISTHIASSIWSSYDCCYFRMINKIQREKKNAPVGFRPGLCTNMESSTQQSWRTMIVSE